MILNNVYHELKNSDSLFDVMHEVKNSIAVCKGYLDIISDSNGDDNSKYLAVLRNEINRSVNIIEDFMLGRNFSIVKEIVDINFLLVGWCQEMELFVKSKGIDFLYNLSDEDIYIEGDYNKIKQVFINLVKNSVESMNKNNSIIKVCSYIRGKYCYIVISDNGSGINEAVLKKIKDGGFSTKLGGNGIGVKVSNQIIRLHNGSINYYSKDNVGTKVVVKLPVVMI